MRHEYLLLVVAVPFLLGWTGYYTNSGKPIHWLQSGVTLVVDSHGTADSPGEAAFTAIQKSIATWNAVSCPHPELVYGGKVKGEAPGESNPHNLLIFEDQSQWHHKDWMNAIALTTLYYRTDTGVIEKTDIEYADFAYQFTTTSDPGKVKTDIENTTTHEMGHVLGLNDNKSAKDWQTTMYGTAGPGDLEKRTLSEDDTDGLCSVYAFMKDPGWETAEETSPMEGDGGCKATGAPGSPGLGVILGLAIGFIARARVRRRGHRWWTTAVLPAAMLIPAPVNADDVLDIQVRSKVLAGTGKPALTLAAMTAVKGVTVSLGRADGKAARTYKVGALRAGEKREFVIEQEAGRAEWKAEVSRAGLPEPEVISFMVVVARPLKLEISKDTVDLADGRIAFTASEPVGRVTLRVVGEGGKVLTDLDVATTAAAGKPASVDFVPPGEPVTLLQLRVYDQDGFFNGVDITPFFVEIPHEEVNFEFGKADILPSEEGKMARTLEEVRKALAKFGNELKARLYVAGYTDTVGTRDYNQDLSDRRAMAIARWFSAHGLQTRVCHQGFGEDALAVQTPDETPEPRNRRTIHVLGSQAPAVSKSFPRSNWRCL